MWTIFSKTVSNKFLRLYTDYEWEVYERGVKQSNTEPTVKWHVLSMSELLLKHSRARKSITFYKGSDVEEKLREALARHAQCCGRKMSLAPRSAPRSEVTALDTVGAAWSSLEECFAMNVSIQRMFRDFLGGFKSGQAHIFTAELVAELNTL